MTGHPSPLGRSWPGLWRTTLGSSSSSSRTRARERPEIADWTKHRQKSSISHFLTLTIVGCPDIWITQKSHCQTAETSILLMLIIMREEWVPRVLPNATSMDRRGSRLRKEKICFFIVQSLFDAILTSSPVGTSTVVYRRSVGENLRFPEGLIYGEDKFLWMNLALAARRVTYSTRCEAAYGRGVNIFASATWGTPAVLKKTFHVAKVHRMIATSFDLTQEQHRWNIAWLEEVRRTFAANLLHLLHHRKPIDWRVVAAYLAMDPRLAGDFVTALVKEVLRLARDSR